MPATYKRRRIKVVGVTFKNPDGSDRQGILEDLYDNYWTEGSEGAVHVRLKQEPDNEYDPNAVSIWVSTPDKGEAQIGYVGREDSWVGKLMTIRRIVKAKIAGMTMTSSGKVSAQIQITVRV